MEQQVLFLIHLFICAFMTGLIWTIQWVHYPAFSSISEDKFLKFHADHSRNISLIVVPVMLLELATAALLVLNSPKSVILKSNGAMLLLIWSFTFFLSVPLHSALAQGYDLKFIRRLVATNWLRTIFWSARSALLISFFLKGSK